MPSRSTSPGLFAESPAKTPSTGWITAHCDGGARGNPGPSGYGAEITDADGNVIAELSEFLGIRTNNYAEYSGLLASLQYALDHGHRRLRVISDSELMVKQIQGKYKVNSPDLKPLWQEARSRIARLEAFEITHALRHKNKAADALANQAMDRGMNRSPAAIPAPRPSPTAPTPIPIPYPTNSKVSAQPNTATKPAAMLRGFTRDGVVHILGGATLPEGIFVKIIPE
jgi:probable phosphoglycerate mutase